MSLDTRVRHVTYREKLRGRLHVPGKATIQSQKILGNDQLDALSLNAFILCLYMFRAASAHHQEGQIVSIHHLV
jgi:hypothetical protein